MELSSCARLKFADDQRRGRGAGFGAILWSVLVDVKRVAVVVGSSWPLPRRLTHGLSHQLLHAE